MYFSMLIAFFATSLWAWVLLIIGIKSRRRAKRHLKVETSPTTGVITDYVRVGSRSDKPSKYTYIAPVVEYTANGKTYSATYTRNTMNQEKFPIGTHMDLCYNFSDPTQCHLAEDPFYATAGRNAILISIIWILLSVAVSIFMGLYGDNDFWYR